MLKKKRETRMIHPLPELNLAPPKALSRRNISLPQKSSNCFAISNFLSEEECKQLIRETDHLNYTSLAAEYPRTFRDSTRVLVRSQQLADVLYDRLKAFFSPSDINNARPYGFGNAGVWKPIGLNDVFKFSRYIPQGGFKPHYDGCFVVSNNVRSIFTLLIYLNADFTGGKTCFEPRSQPDFNYIRFWNCDPPKGEVQITPKTGMALVFNHDVSHAGTAVKSGVKYVVKTEVIFRRTDWSIIPSQLKNYKKDPLYRQAAKLYALSNELEKKGDVSGATSVYLQAMDIQVKFKTYPKQQVSQDNTQCLSNEIFAHIFEFVQLKTVVNSARASRRWFYILRDGMLWFRLFKRHFPSRFEVENLLQRKEKEGTAFLKDWYTVYKTAFLLTRSKHPVICVDFGGCSFKYGLCGEEIYSEPTQVGLERHPHYLLAGGGLLDCWKAGDPLSKAGHMPSTFRPFTHGQVVDWHAMWLLMHRIYLSLSESREKEQQRRLQLIDIYKQHFNPHLNPVLLAEGSIPFDREKLHHLMFALLEVPSVCIADSALLAIHAIRRVTGMVVDCGKEGVVCTPVWYGAVLKERRKTYKIGARLMMKYFNYICPSGDADHKWKYSAAKKVFRVVLDPKELETPQQTVVHDHYLYSQGYHQDMVKDIYNNEHMKAPEILFNSRLLLHTRFDFLDTEQCPSVTDFVYDLLMEFEEPQRTELFNCVLLCGGLVKMNGFSERFEKELQYKGNKVKVVIPPDPELAIVEGAYFYASSPSFASSCVNRLDYLASLSQPDLACIKVVETTVVGELNAKLQNL